MAAAAPGTFCEVPLPDAWKSALREGTVPVAAEARMIPFTLAEDGSQLFAAYYSPAWSGVVSVVPRTGALTRIRAFANPGVEQVTAGAFDGRFLAWVEGHSRTDWNDWTLHAWDSRGDQTFDISAAPRRQGGLIQGPIVIPAVSRGQLAWVQVNAEGKGEAHLYALATRKDRILSRGGATAPVSFWGENILWQEIDVPGQSGHLAMASTRTGEHVNLPEPLASIHHLAYLATSDDLVAWGDGSSVWVWRPGEQRLQQLVNNRMGRPQFLSIVGGMVAWDENDGPVMADLRSGSLTRLTERYGGRFARGRALVVYHPPEGKLRPGMALLSEVVDVSRLPPLPTCGP